MSDDIVEMIEAELDAIAENYGDEIYAEIKNFSLLAKAKAEIERLREALRPNDKMVGDIAHIITQICGGTCCYRTGGRGGPSAIPNCECREVASEIMKIYEARAALGEKE